MPLKRSEAIVLARIRCMCSGPSSCETFVWRNVYSCIMANCCRFATFLATLLVLYAFPVAAQDQPSGSDDATFRVDVQLVQFDVEVLQKKSLRPVGSLTKDDFELYEDGARQQIADISRDQLPLSVVLLFDLTDSVRPVLKPLASGALAALQHLKPEDEVAVMVYAAKTRLLQGFTTDHEKVVTAIKKASKMESSEKAFFNQAIYEASAQLDRAANPKSRRVIIWLTDNVPNVPSDLQYTEQEAIREAFETGTVVSALVERSEISDVMSEADGRNPMLMWSRSHHPPGDVNRYAEVTGGEVMKSGSSDVSTKLAELIDQIRTRYTLGYHPSEKEPKGKFCAVKVQLRPETQKNLGRVIVRTKQGYYR